MREGGFSESAITVEAYHEDRDPQPPIRISYLRFVAELPKGPSGKVQRLRLLEVAKAVP